MKKVISLMLSLVMLMSITVGLNLTAYAEKLTGSCGENATYSLDTETGVLTIDGMGDMQDYDNELDRPWHQYRDFINSIIIGAGITSISEYAFDNCYGLKSIKVNSNNTVFDGRYNCNAIVETATNTIVRGCQNTFIPNDITTIGNSAFYGCSNLVRIAIPISVVDIDEWAFSNCDNLTDIYYTGTEDEWNEITIKNGNLSFTEKTPHVNHTHSYAVDDTGSVIPPTCTEKGYTAHTCTVCGGVDIDSYVDATGHNYTDVVTEPTCTEKGYTTHTCSICNDSYVDTYVDALGHNFGSNSPTCLTCGVANPNYVAPAPTPAVTQPATSQTATTQTVTTATTVKKPKATSIKKLSKAKKSFKVTYKKISGVTGYQVTYSTSKKFTKKTTKTVTIKGAKNTSKTIKKLKAKKKYYVKVRTYKTVKVNGKSKKVYSSWSKTKTVTTK